MTGPLAVAARPPSALVLSLLRDRLTASGWAHRRDPLTGREEWVEPALPAGQREPRAVRVDELFCGASGWVVQGCNGHEHVTVRCLPDTDPAIVLVTLDLWRMLPDQGVARPAPPVSVPAVHAVSLVAARACTCGATFGGDGIDPETAMTLLDHHITTQQAGRAEAVSSRA
ncbi:hypothetical protein AB0N38_33265 [Micromonospora aurantiaca]|uniref:hypothetical protein n=1 Tax=Micromonospora aurantiaca (nom. illeg.) TaxID=47850 RepID=UPI0034340296